MKITHIDITRVHVPQVHDPNDQPVETPNDGYIATANLDKHIIRLHTDTGLLGLGETWKGTPDAAVDAAARSLIGLDPTRLSLLHLPLPYSPDLVNARDMGTLIPVMPVAHNPSIHAFEIAIGDIVGQAHGVPLCQLLGGAVRQQVLVHYWSGRRSPDALALVAHKAKALGFGGIKLKCVLEDPNIERVQAIYAACGPDFRITLDPNQRFHTIAATVKLAEALAGYPIELFEDPLPKKNGFADYAKLRTQMDIPVGLHLERPEDVLEAIRLDAADIFNLRGTMAMVHHLGYLAEIAGIRIWRGSGLDLGILDASYVHVCAATPSCTLGSDIVGQFAREDDLIVTPLTYDKGYVHLPTGPGLGVKLDQEALVHYTVKSGDHGGPATWTV